MDLELFNKFRSKFEYFVDIIPIKIQYGFYNYGVFIKANDHVKCFDFDDKIPIPEFIEKIIEKWLKNKYPVWVKYTEVEKPISIEKAKTTIKTNPKLDIKTLLTMIEKHKVETRFQIYRVFTKDKNFLLYINNDCFIYSYEFAEDFRDIVKNISDIKQLLEFLDKCNKLGFYEKDFGINIRYSGDMMLNFFRLNKSHIDEKIIFDEELRAYHWGRYCIYFDNEEIKQKCLRMVKHK